MTAFCSFRTQGRRERRRSVAAALALLAAVALGAALAAGCGVSDGGAGESASPGAPTQVTATTAPSPGESATAAADEMVVRVYFLRGEKLGVAERPAPRSEAVATAAMSALCLGPNAEDQGAGLSSAVPAGTRLLGLTIKGGVAIVDLSGEFASGGGSLAMQARVAQVVYTLTQYPTVKAVDFRIDGEPLTELGGEGLMLDSSQKRADWRDFEPAIFVERPGVGAVLGSPFALEGTAMVFEGSFMAELEDAGGSQLVRTPVQASAGGPERGDFSKTVQFTTSATRGTLIVYAQSMEDGSRQDEVRIPVTFAP